MKNRIAAIVAAVLLALAAPLAALDPGQMSCFAADGTPTTFSIAAASAYGGGILYANAGGQHLTTWPCIANLGPAACAMPVEDGWRVVMECADPVGLYAYFDPAWALSLDQGVWLFKEDSNVGGNCYLSNMACAAFPSALP